MQFTQIQTGKRVLVTQSATDIINCRKTYYVDQIPRLPSAYQEVEHIWFSDTAWIQTGVIATGRINLSTSVKCEGSQWPFGTGQNPRLAMFFNNTTVLQVYNDNPVTDGVYQYNHTYVNYTTVNLYRTPYNGDSPWTEVNGIKVTRTRTTSVSESIGEMYVGAWLYGSTVRHFIGRMKYFKMSCNDVPVLDLVPCYRKSDSVPGMYNLVTGVFYTSAGSGSFSVGPAVYPLTPVLCNKKYYLLDI